MKEIYKVWTNWFYTIGEGGGDEYDVFEVGIRDVKKIQSCPDGSTIWVFYLNGDSTVCHNINRIFYKLIAD